MNLNTVNSEEDRSVNATPSTNKSVTTENVAHYDKKRNFETQDSGLIIIKQHK